MEIGLLRSNPCEQSRWFRWWPPGEVLLVGKQANRAQRTRGTNFKGVGVFFYMSVFFLFLFLFFFIFLKKTRGITHEKENDKAGPDQPTEGIEDTL